MEHHVGCLVVVEQPSPEDRVVVGMLTDRDIVTAVVADDRDPHDLRVGDVMSKDVVVTAHEQDSVLDVMAAMRRTRLRRIPMTGPQGTLIGIVALDDVLEIVAAEMQALASAVGAAQKQKRTARP
ncbi:CBS domain-containing protein [Polaromonas sp. UBA4122]|uniref:CBS domain-containing protein n=1 Tax=Polaromonas sp. UBA4122 TaxID=1947074 RepID=UPI0025EF9061|nr:CBS domain-containing protein [Polaromonas sp. UBA4122]